MPGDDFSTAERVIIRNQRYIMLALVNLLQNTGGMASGYHAESITKRVKDMERVYEWVASPSERLG